MDKKQKEMILAGILIVVFAYVVYANFIAPGRETPAPAPVPVEEPPVAPPVPAPPPARRAVRPPARPEPDEPLPAVDERLIRLQEARADEPWGRDPFNPAPTPAVPVDPVSEWRDFRLTGVIPGPRGMAIINGEAVSIGETFRGFTLREVDVDRIQLEKDGEFFPLKMPEE